MAKGEGREVLEILALSQNYYNPPYNLLLKMSIPKVAIVGRVNVGKSTLFNRLARKPLSITSKIPGVTRDRIEKEITHNGFTFRLVDTGGLYPPEEDLIFHKVKERINSTVEESDLIIFLVDLKTGLTDYDKEIADYLRKKGKEVLLVANKADVKYFDPFEFEVLGFGVPVVISAEHNKGIEELKDEIVEKLKKKLGYIFCEEKERIPVAILGRPNVGKSTLLNSLLRREVTIVSPIPFTTRDSVDVEFEEFIFVDTAGLRKKFDNEIDYFSTIRTHRSLNYAQIAIVVIDINEGVTHMDKEIIGLVVKRGKGIVICLNKIDLVAREARKRLIDIVERDLSFVYYAPKLFVSALNGENVSYLIEVLRDVKNSIYTPISQRKVKLFLRWFFNSYSTSCAIKEIKVISRFPLVIEVSCIGGKLKNTEVRFLERKFRERFPLKGVPILWKVIQV